MENVEIMENVKMSVEIYDYISKIGLNIIITQYTSVLRIEM